MSHLKERKEKNCLNCNAEVHGKYCHICGQENIHPKESFWHLLNHFFQDITHFDGKFFSTLNLLIFCPGFISREYMMGRRMSYLNPIRMYIFSSAIFFIVFFSIAHVDETTFRNMDRVMGTSVPKIDNMDSAHFAVFTAVLNDTLTHGRDKTPMTRTQFEDYLSGRNDSTKATFTNRDEYDTKAAYDSALGSGKLHDGWVLRKLVYREIELNEKYHGRQRQLLIAYINTFVHSFPQVLFITLPLFALLLKLLYARRKEYYYVNHAIFTIHLFTFFFIALLAIIAIYNLSNTLHWEWLKNISGLISFLIFVYNYKAMRNFYQQGRWKTIGKLVILHIINFIIMLFILLIFVFFSLYKI